MKKTPKCSIWNNFKGHFFRLVAAALFSITAVFIPLVSAVAAPAVVPVAGEALYALLVALGLMTGNAIDGYSWTSDDRYVTDIFNTSVPGFTSGIKKPSVADDLAQAQAVLNSVMAETAYSTDGENFYVTNTNKRVTPSDIFLQARSLVGANYLLPVNIQGVTDYTSLVSGTDKGWYSPVSFSEIQKNNCFFPIYGYNGLIYYSWHILNISPNGSIILYNWDGGVLASGATSGGSGVPSFISTGSKTLSPYVFSSGTPSINGNWRFGTSAYGGHNAWSLSGHLDISTVWNEVNYCTFLITDGAPTTDLIGDKDKLENAVVQVNSDDDNNNNGSTPPAPQSPNNWQIWQTVTELIDEIGDGVSTNNGTTFGEYVNNNYNYVKVDINVPDTQNINMSGGFDISGKGDLNININEDISLPSAGDGSGFYNPNAADVVGALSKDNPVTSTISALFDALDPALVGVFSVSISLALVLGLWKLIRG